MNGFKNFQDMFDRVNREVQAGLVTGCDYRVEVEMSQSRYEFTVVLINDKGDQHDGQNGEE